jgi:hypothetical protein
MGVRASRARERANSVTEDDPRWGGSRGIHFGVRRALAISLLLAVTSCARHPLVERQIESAYASAAAVDTLHDYEVAELAAAAELARVEGLLSEQRNDAELLALAARGWCRYAFFFAWDAREAALERGDVDAALYHAERTLAGFERARAYARELFESEVPGFPASRDAKATASYLDAFEEPEQAPLLLWAGCAELGVALVTPVARDAEIARRTAALFLDQGLFLDPALGDGTGELLLAVDLALAGERPPAVAARLERARRESEAKLLFVDLAHAVYVDCARRDPGAFVATLDRIARSPELSAQHRLDDVVAKRRARRYLSSRAWRARCGG